MAGKKSGGSRERGSVIVKKYETVEGGHHGGAWKVAYADFVTAMMAFFLLMWLLNATTEDQRKGLADYFAPSNLMSHASSGTGKPFGGRTPFEKGELVSDLGAKAVIQGKAVAQPEAEEPEVDDGPETVSDGQKAKPTGGDGDEEGTRLRAQEMAMHTAPGQPGGTATAAARVQSQALGQAQALANAGDGAKTPAGAPDAAALRIAAERQERQAFETAEKQLRDAIKADPALSEVSKQLTIDMTREGLRIQLLDEDKQPMFASGSAAVAEHARLLLQKVAAVLLKLPESISISGHTDATPFKGGDRTNWELSAERANATRRLLSEAGVPQERFRSVTGNADRDPLLPADPFAAANRRIAIVVLRAAGR